MMKASAIFTLSALFLTSSSSVLAQVQRPVEIVDSHLVCHRANNLDPTPTQAIKAKFAANLNQQEYSLDSCRINTRKIELCVPATKRVSYFAGTQYPQVLADNGVEPQPIKNDFLCYKMRCRDNDERPREQIVADQFGQKKIELLPRVYKVCVPAWKVTEDGDVIIVEN